MPTKTNHFLDLGTFGAILIVSNPRLTVISIHEWLAVSLAGAAIAHLLFHWEWIVRIGKDFFRKLWHQSRLNFVANALFFIAMTGAMFSGLLTSESLLATFGIHLDVSRSWKSIHVLMSDTTVILLGVHFGLHWNWVVTSLGRYVLNPVRGLFQRQSLPQVLTAQPVEIEKNRQQERKGRAVLRRKPAPFLHPIIIEMQRNFHENHFENHHHTVCCRDCGRSLFPGCEQHLDRIRSR